MNNRKKKKLHYGGTFKLLLVCVLILGIVFLLKDKHSFDIKFNARIFNGFSIETQVSTSDSEKGEETQTDRKDGKPKSVPKNEESTSRKGTSSTK